MLSGKDGPTLTKYLLNAFAMCSFPVIDSPLFSNSFTTCIVFFFVFIILFRSFHVSFKLPLFSSRSFVL